LKAVHYIQTKVPLIYFKTRTLLHQNPLW